MNKANFLLSRRSIRILSSLSWTYSILFLAFGSFRFEVEQPIDCLDLSVSRLAFLDIFPFDFERDKVFYLFSWLFLTRGKAFELCKDSWRLFLSKDFRFDPFWSDFLGCYLGCLSVSSTKFGFCAFWTQFLSKILLLAEWFLGPTFLLILTFLSLVLLYLELFIFPLYISKVLFGCCFIRIVPLGDGLNDGS